MCRPAVNFAGTMLLASNDLTNSTSDSALIRLTVVLSCRSADSSVVLP